MNETKLGVLLSEHEYRKDAVHVALVPVTAGEDLEPGQRVKLLNDDPIRPIVGFAYDDEDAVGVIDPFLKGIINKGNRCYLCLAPGTVTSLRHVWTHPAFKFNSINPNNQNTHE